MNSVKTLLFVSCVLLTTFLFGQTAKEHLLSNSLAPFLREGDRPLLSFILQNKKKTDWTGSASLNLKDGKNKESVDGWFMNSVANQYFTVDSESQYQLLFPIEVPFLYNQPLNWKLSIESPNDSLVSQGSVPILSWPYEDSINTPTSFISIATLEKKVNSRMPLHVGQKVEIEISFELKKNMESLILKEEWAAGLVPEKGAVKLIGKLTPYFFENKTAQHRNLKFTNLSPGVYTLRYNAIATYPGVFNQPPSLLFAHTASSYLARSSYEKISIE